MINRYIKQMPALILLIGTAFSSKAQTTSQKIGENPTIKNEGAVLELESTNKGVLFPRVALSNTTTWGLAGTATRGMLVYNTRTTTDASPFMGTAAYPVATGDGTGLYFWDGNGWAAAARTSGADLSKDAWIDDNGNSRIHLGTLSSGAVRPVGTEVVIKDDGKVGIGTASPSWMLDVQGPSAYGQFRRMNNVPTNPPGFLFTRARGTQSAEADIQANDYLGKIQFRARLSGSDSDFATMGYRASGTTVGQGYFTFTSGHLGKDIVTMNTGNGNVGVGVVTATSRLSVLDSASNTYLQLADFYAPSNISTGNNSGIRFGVSNTDRNSADLRFNYQGSSSDSNRIDFGFNGIANPRFSIQAGGNVGVGTTSPSAYLHIANPSSSTSVLKLDNLSNSKDKQLSGTINYNINSAQLYADGNGHLYKRYNPVSVNASAMTFDGAYTVGAGVGSATNIVSLNNGSIVRFELLVNSLILGQAGIGANLYADVTYGYGGGGFRVATYASEAGGNAVNPLTVSGQGTNTLTFDFATGSDLIITNTSNTEAGPLAIYNTGSSSVTVEIFHSFRSR